MRQFFSKLVFLTLLLAWFSCGTLRKNAAQTRMPAPKIVDSLYNNITTINSILEDKAAVLAVLEKLRAHENDIIHIQEMDEAEMHYLVFPLRIVQVVQAKNPIFLEQKKLDKGVQILNGALKDAWVQFEPVAFDTIVADLDIDLLKKNLYERYFEFSFKHDLQDTCTLYLFDNVNDLCKNYACARTQGFANTLELATNNVVLDKFFMDDYKVIAHEFGHYFGLYHTTEERFGKEKVDGSNCLTAGDMICDTPADPGVAYSVYVNFSTCQMEGLKEEGSGQSFNPSINNYMSYYPPCYMKPFVFSQDQLNVIFNAAVKVRHNQIIAVAEFPLGF